MMDLLWIAFGVLCLAYLWLTDRQAKNDRENYLDVLDKCKELGQENWVNSGGIKCLRITE